MKSNENLELENILFLLFDREAAVLLFYGDSTDFEDC